MESLAVLCWPLRVDNWYAEPAGTTNATSVDNVDTDEHDGGLSWLKKAATPGRLPPPAAAKDTLNRDPLAEALSGRPIAATTTNYTGPRSTPAQGENPSDWLVAAVSGHTQRESSDATGKAPSRKNGDGHGGGAWITAGKLGISVGDDDYETENDIRSTKVRPAGIVTAAERASACKNDAGRVPPVVSTGPGGWLAAAVTSGRLGILGRGDMDNAGEADSGIIDNFLRSKGVTVETQTEENIGQAVKESVKPRLPPWAKPWNPPTAVVDKHRSPSSADKESSHVVEETKGNSATPAGGGLNWITATIDAPSGSTKGDYDCKCPWNAAFHVWVTRYTRWRHDLCRLHPFLCIVDGCILQFATDFQVLCRPPLTA